MLDTPASRTITNSLGIRTQRDGPILRVHRTQDNEIEKSTKTGEIPSASEFQSSPSNIRTPAPSSKLSPQDLCAPATVVQIVTQPLLTQEHKRNSQKVLPVAKGHCCLP